MNFCVLMGSPRLKGNTAELLKPFVDELKKMSAHEPRLNYKMRKNYQTDEPDSQVRVQGGRNILRRVTRSPAGALVATGKSDLHSGELSGREKV